MLPSETAVEGGCEGRRKKVVDYRGVKEKERGWVGVALSDGLKNNCLAATREF